ncbi:MAG: hypothetical protein OXI76_04950 [Gemmatimonadota bacterium]|nr:hypothetical protein [Gemmatimonadota bacterium]
MRLPSSAGPEESRRILEAFADKGGNQFDTANDSEFWQQLAFQFDERAFDIARKVDEIADRHGTCSARGGPGVGARPRRDPDDRGRVPNAARQRWRYVGQAFGGPGLAKR